MFRKSEVMEANMQGERKTLTQLSVPICLETLFYMLSGMVDTLMLSSVSDHAVGAWSETLLKNAESLRDSAALMRVAVPRRRGPAGLRDLFAIW